MDPLQESLLPSKPKLQESPSIFFYVCVLVSAVGAFLFGCALGFTSPTLVQNELHTSSMCPTSSCTANGTHLGDGSLFWSGDGHFGAANSSNKYVDGNCDNKDKMNCDLQFSEGFQSLFGSIVNFGCLFGALAGGGFVDRFGKKVGMATALVLYAIGFALILFVPSPNVATWDATESKASNMTAIEVMLIASRLITGFGVGIVCCSVSNYQTEASTLALRGAIGTMFQASIVLGLFVVYLVGSVVAWRTLAGMCFGVSLVGLLGTAILVESPVWLLTKARKDDAKSALARLRNENVGSIDEQFREAEEMVEMTGSTDDDEAAGGFGELCSDPASRKALFIGVFLMFVQQLSGINAIMFYAGQIYAAVPGTSAATANSYSTGMQGMQLAITLSSAFFMDRAGRVPILLFAAVGQCICCGGLAYYYLFADCTKVGEVVVSASMGVFPVVVLYGYVFFFSCGMGAIPWFLMGEIFKPTVKGLASSIATAVNWFLSFIITFTVSKLEKLFHSAIHKPEAINTGYGGVFLTYGIVCGIGVLFVVFFVPETKGLTVTEVQNKLKRGKKAAVDASAGASSSLQAKTGYQG